jgi:hypothetical protein
VLAAKEPRVKTVIKETPEEKKARGALSLPLPERLALSYWTAGCVEGCVGG